MNEMTAKKRTIIDSPGKDGHVIIEEQVNPNDQPTVLAYRVGQVEIAVREGFEKQSKRLDDLVSGFVTEKELHAAKEEADEEHRQLWGAIKEIKNNTKWWVSTGIGATAAIAGAAYTVSQIVRH